MTMLAAVLLASLGATSPEVLPYSGSGYDAEAEAARIIGGHGFCTDPSYPITDDERRWCPHVVEASERCPALAQACASERVPLDEGQPHRLGRRRRLAEPSKSGCGSDSPDASTSPDAAPPSGSRRERAKKAGDADFEIWNLGGFGQALFWVVLGVAVLVLGLAIFRNTAAGRLRDESQPDAAPSDATDDDEHVGSEAEEAAARTTDVDRLLAQARDLAAQGRWPDAIGCAHAALLRRLDHRGEIRLHRSRTTGDYLRELRATPELRGPVRDALREIDRAFFSGEEPDRAAFESILARVTAALQRAGSTMLVWVLIAIGFGCGAANEARRYRWADSPSGVAATIELLRAADVDAGYATEPLDQVKNPLDAVVLLRGAELSSEQWKAVRAMVNGGGLLVLVDDEQHVGWGAEVSRSSAPIQDADATAIYHYRYSDAAQPLVVPAGKVVGGGGGQPFHRITRGGSSYGVSWEVGFGEVLVLPNDDLFSNASLAMPGNATAVVDLLAPEAGRVRFFDAWEVEGADSPVASIANSHLTAAVLQLLALMGLLYWWRGARFGRPRRLLSPSRRAFSRHAQAMARLYGRAGALGHAAAVYSAWALDRLREVAPHTAGPGLHGLAQALARRTGRDETSIVALLVEAHGAVEQGTVDNDQAALRIIRGLMALLREDHS